MGQQGLTNDWTAGGESLVHGMSTLRRLEEHSHAPEMMKSAPSADGAATTLDLSPDCRTLWYEVSIDDAE